MTSTSVFFHQPNPGQPGWNTWDVANSDRLDTVVLGKPIVRRQRERSARLRMLSTETRRSNMHGVIQGAVTLTLIDVGMVATVYSVLDGDEAGSVTLDPNYQFIGAGKIDLPLDVRRDHEGNRPPCGLPRDRRARAWVGGKLARHDPQAQAAMTLLL